MPVADLTKAEAKRIGELLRDVTTDLGGRLRRAGIR